MMRVTLVCLVLSLACAAPRIQYVAVPIPASAPEPAPQPAYVASTIEALAQKGYTPLYIERHYEFGYLHWYHIGAMFYAYRTSDGNHVLYRHDVTPQEMQEYLKQRWPAAKRNADRL